MPTYIYQGQNMRTRARTSGERTANNENELRMLLRRESIGNLSIQEKKTEKTKEKKAVSFGGKKVKAAEIALFTRQFSAARFRQWGIHPRRRAAYPA